MKRSKPPPQQHAYTNLKNGLSNKKKPHSTFAPLIFLFVKPLLLSLLHTSMLTPVIDATEELGIHVMFTPFLNIIQALFLYYGTFY